jgi:transposase-like protein
LIRFLLQKSLMAKSSGQLQLPPPYCPNSLCLFHNGTEERFYTKNGYTLTDKVPFKNQRYRCKRCKIQFSENTFKIDYRRKIPGLEKDILEKSLHGMSNNSIARGYKISESSVRSRLKTLSHQSKLFEKEFSIREIKENLAYDGFETFTNSQFQPCYLNTVVGSHSMFNYEVSFSPLNRKGRMTEEQKRKQEELLKKHGPFPRDSVFQESKFIFQNLSILAPGRILFTDEHHSYDRAIKSFDCKLVHEKINSKEKRDPSNPLFPINRLHNNYRHYLSSQHRETISFHKHEAALMEKAQLMKVYHNFMRTKFVKKNKYDPNSHEWSPAMYLGLTEKVLSFEDVFGVRKLKSQVKLSERDEQFLGRVYPYSRQKIAA